VEGKLVPGRFAQSGFVRQLDAVLDYSLSMSYKRNLFGLIVGLYAGLLTAYPCKGQAGDLQHGANNPAMKAVLRQYLKDHDVENDIPVRYVTAFVDLNDDGVKEVIVHLISQSVCGTGGCPTLVLAPTQSSFRIISRITITRPPIRVLEMKSNGWHDLTVWVQGGGIRPGYEADLPFDGESYATNPTVSPAHRLTPKTAGRTVISDKDVGTPLD
jgi:hypothetical protein